MATTFAPSRPFTVGIEEELLLVDAETLQLAHEAERVVGAIDADAELVDYEAFAAQIELRSHPAAGAAAASSELHALRAMAREAAGAAANAALLASGLHPAAAHGDTRLVDLERYQRVRNDMRGLIQRTPESALHVHVGMPDAETAIQVFNGLRGWLPLLQGLAASSPFWFGSDSGLASARWALVRPYPGRGIPRALRDMDDYEAMLADASTGGGPEDYTLLWWDVRPHPRLGTVEVRELDSQPRLRDARAIAALIRGLARHEAQARSEPVAAEALEWSAFRAVRDGLDAEIVWDGRLSPLREVARRAIELAQPAAREAGDEGAVDEVKRIVSEGNSSDRQRAAHRKGGMRAVLELLRRETNT